MGKVQSTDPGELAIPGPRTEFLYKLAQSFRWIRSRIEATVKSHGLTYSTWTTLMYLQRAGEGVSQKDLAAIIRIETPSLVGLLDSLEKQTLIERRASPRDRRSNGIFFTARAKDLLHEINEIGVEIREQLLSEFSDDELDACVRVFDKLLDKT